jgi:hypothetical protein
MRWVLEDKAPPSECFYYIKGFEISDVKSGENIMDNDDLSLANDDGKINDSIEEDQTFDNNQS